MRVNRTAIVSLLAALALVLVPAGALAARALLVDGSTSVFPLATQLAAAYHKAFPKLAKPKIGQGQSDAGINDVASGRVDIADVSRDPIQGVDPHGLIFTKIAQDGICLITNSANPISNLSTQQVQAIFTGQTRDWSDIPGSKVSGPIDLFDRDGASGTQDAFQNIFLGQDLKVSPSATAETSNGLVQNAVRSTPNAIGFVSFAFTEGVNAVPYQGIPCTLRNAKSGQYQGVRNFWMVTKGAPKAAASKFLKWVTSSHNKVARRIIASNWIAIH
ncbi:MAG TPA: phosphate ABC transporter substrate-binding protein [Solirubrobacteraceae bacterium]|nr:phosphate ABC transporter substrate-binding protein [Solirubrobacteraceae bacterium]